MRLEILSKNPTATEAQKKLFKFSSKKFGGLKKSPYLCSRNRKESESSLKDLHINKEYKY